MFKGVGKVYYIVNSNRRYKGQFIFTPVFEHIFQFALEVWILLTANGVFQILLYRISSIIAQTLILSIQYGPTGGSVIFNRCHLQVEKVLSVLHFARNVNQLGDRSLHARIFRIIPKGTVGGQSSAIYFAIYAG